MGDADKFMARIFGIGHGEQTYIADSGRRALSVYSRRAQWILFRTGVSEQAFGSNSSRAAIIQLMIFFEATYVASR